MQGWLFPLPQLSRVNWVCLMWQRTRFALVQALLPSPTSFEAVQANARTVEHSQGAASMLTWGNAQRKQSKTGLAAKIGAVQPVGTNGSSVSRIRRRQTAQKAVRFRIMQSNSGLNASQW